MDSLQAIITRTDKPPTIVNQSSRYVVATYWWGRGNLNGNTARPCISFFEELVNAVIKYVVNFFIDLMTNQRAIRINSVDELMRNFLSHVETTKGFNRIIDERSKQYMGMVDLVPTKSPSFVPKSLVETTADFKAIMLVVVDINKELLFNLFRATKDMTTLKTMFFSERELLSPEEGKDILGNVKTLVARNRQLNDEIKTNLKRKQDYDIIGTRFTNMNIYDILNKRFRFLEPVTFEAMIAGWEQECARYGCNYLSVEYPEFAKPGGYQMAINAKPLFIQRALALSPGRGVLYIDGDMYIRKYPAVFDIPNIDFMGRGWNIDARSGADPDVRPFYDPYAFETSGGTLFFSQSTEAANLIGYWIKECSNPQQGGKADDRILSLIFNAKKFLLNVNILQLPIEYLWLTLDYDERLPAIYDYDIAAMHKTVFIEHPECLTSEETAAGAGAANDRMPKFYRFIEDSLTISEETYEYLTFPSAAVATDAFGEYHDFMANTPYVDDGSKHLIENHFVDPENPENNEYPLYVVKYADKYGKRAATAEKNRKQVAFYSTGQNLMMKPPSPMGFTEINEQEIEKPEYTIPIIIALLTRGLGVLYKPKNMDPAAYTTLLTRNTTNLELVFFPLMGQMTHVLKPSIDLTAPMFFRATEKNSRLVAALYMFDTLSDLSAYLSYGSYQILSLVRMGYVFKPRQRGGGGGGGHGPVDESSFIEEYEQGVEIMYPSAHGPTQTAGRRHRTRRRKGHARGRKTTRKHRRRVRK